MKTTVSILLFLTMSLSGGKFGDDNPSGDWLPIKDGYNWPVANKNEPTFSTTWKKFSRLDKKLRVILMSYDWPKGVNPEKVEMAEIDLNADGKKEIFVQLPMLGGTGGLFYEIFTLSGGGYKSIGGLQGSLQFVARKNKWLQIEGLSRVGGGQYSRFLMTYMNGEYQISRCEIHNFNTKKVTITKTEQVAASDR